MSKDIKYDWLIAGLGNPGNRYEKTRHNIGWMVLDYFARKFNKEFKHQFYYDKFDINLHDVNIAVIKPNIFMNNSGEPIQRFLERFEIPIDRVLVVCDEFNFPLGKIHLKKGGSDGGHNGVGSIIEKLGEKGFIRLRCGIGHDFGPNELVSYVLSNFPDKDKNELDTMIIRASDSIEFILYRGLNKAMSIINSGQLWNPVKKEAKEAMDINQADTNNKS